jgi:hypothetical protein
VRERFAAGDQPAGDEVATEPGEDGAASSEEDEP